MLAICLSDFGRRWRRRLEILHPAEFRAPAIENISIAVRSGHCLDVSEDILLRGNGAGLDDLQDRFNQFIR